MGFNLLQFRMRKRQKRYCNCKFLNINPKGTFSFSRNTIHLEVDCKNKHFFSNVQVFLNLCKNSSLPNIINVLYDHYQRQLRLK